MVYQTIKSQLSSAGVEAPDFEARILFEDIAGLTLSDLVNGGGRDLPPEMYHKIFSIVKRRVAGESLWRILGYRDFWKSRFYLSDDTLEPRPDTETLIEEVLRETDRSGFSPRKILDLGTGTGCILLSLLQEYQTATGIGIDLAKGACLTAAQNAAHLGLQDRVKILNGSWFDPLPADSRFDLIVSNPPYIPTEEIRNLDSIVQNHDPILALDGGKDGLLPYKYLCLNLKKYLEPGGIVFFEFGVGQVDDLTRIVEETGATLIRVADDLGGHPRVLKFRYGDN